MWVWMLWGFFRSMSSTEELSGQSPPQQRLVGESQGVGWLVVVVVVVVSCWLVLVGWLLLLLLLTFSFYEQPKVLKNSSINSIGREASKRRGIVFFSKPTEISASNK